MAILEHTGHDGLSIEPGEIVSILGAPGSGKTRLGQELAFLQRPASGEVLFRGKNPARRRSVLRPFPRPREVTLLVQNAEEQLFARTVFDDVAFGPRLRFLPEDEIERRVVSALDTVGLDAEEVRDRSPFALSGGERRRVALAGVLAMEPEVLILDEPLANLDPRARHDFLQLVAPLRETGAIFWLTPSAREAALADRIYLLREGKASEVAAREDLLQDWRRLAEAGIELPAVYELAGAVERRGGDIPSAASAEDLTAALVTAWRDRDRDR